MDKQISVFLTKQEYDTLYYVLGDFKRITRDQYYRFVKTEYSYSESLHNKKQFELAQSLFKKLVEDYR